MTEPEDAAPAADAALQDQVAPDNPCFGCGPHNPQGLHLKSHPHPREPGLTATWRGGDAHAGHPGVLAGGIQATLLDCHGVWTAAADWARDHPHEAFPVVVTAGVDLDYKRPAPTGEPVTLHGEAGAWDGRRCEVDVELRAPDGTVCTQGTITCHRLDDAWGPNPFAGTPPG